MTETIFGKRICDE